MKFAFRLLALLLGCVVVYEVPLNAAQRASSFSAVSSSAASSASSASVKSPDSPQAAKAQAQFIPFVSKKENDLSTFRKKLQGVTNYKIFEGGFPQQLLDDAELFTQEKWGEFQKPLLVAMVITEEETAKGKETNIQPYRAHGFNRWLLEISPEGTRLFRPDPLKRTTPYSKDVYYFELTDDSFEYLCTLDELVAHDNFGEELRNTFLINAGNNPYAAASAAGIPYIQCSQGKVLEKGFVCGPVNFYLAIEQSAFRSAILAMQKAFEMHFQDQKSRMNDEQQNLFKAKFKQLRDQYDSLLKEWYKGRYECHKDQVQSTIIAKRIGSISGSWGSLYEAYENFYDEYCGVLGRKLVYVPDYTNAIVLAHDMWDKMASTASPVAEINGQRGLAVGEYLHRPHEEPRGKHIGKVIGAAALPFVLAFGLGVLNNWLARRSGCGLARWSILKAPLREWIAGGVVRPLQLLSVEYLCQRLFDIHRNRFGRDIEWKIKWLSRLAFSGFLVQVYAGLLQEYGESMPLPGYEGWRSLELLPPQARFGANNLSMHIGLWSMFGSSIGMIGAGLWYGGHGLYNWIR